MMSTDGVDMSEVSEAMSTSNERNNVSRVRT